jgi:hypothetical protein
VLHGVRVHQIREGANEIAGDEPSGGIGRDSNLMAGLTRASILRHAGAFLNEKRVKGMTAISA